MRKFLLIIVTMLLSLNVWSQEDAIKTAYQAMQDELKVRQQMVDDYSNNNNTFKDEKAFFKNEALIAHNIYELFRLTENLDAKAEEQLLSILTAVNPNILNGALKYSTETEFALPLIRSYFEIKDIPQSIAIKIPIEKEAYHVYSALLFNTENLKDAMEKAEEGLRLYPDYEDLISAAGQAAAKQGVTLYDHNKEEARPWFEKTIKYFSQLEKLHPDNHYQWAYFLYLSHNFLGNTEEANKYKKLME